MGGDVEGIATRVAVGISSGMMPGHHLGAGRGCIRGQHSRYVSDLSTISRDRNFEDASRRMTVFFSGKGAVKAEV